MDRLCSARRATLAYYEANIDTITFNTSVGDRNIDATYNHEKLHRHLTLASTSGLVEGLVSKVAVLSKSGEGTKLHRIIRRLLQSSYDIHEGVAVYGSMLLEAAKDPGEPKLMYAQLPRSYRDAVDIVASAFEPVTKITSARVMYHYSILLSCGRVALDVPSLADLSAIRSVTDLGSLIAKDSPDERFRRILETISRRGGKRSLRRCVSRFLSVALGRSKLDVFSALTDLRAAGAPDVENVLLDLAKTLDGEIRTQCPEMGVGGSHVEKASAGNSVLRVLTQEYPAARIIEVAADVPPPRFKTAALTASPSVGPPYGYRTVDRMARVIDSYHARAEAPNGFFVFCRVIVHGQDKPVEFEIVGNELGFQAVTLRQRSAMLMIDIGPDSSILGKIKAQKLYDEIEKRYYGQVEVRSADALIRALAGLRLFLHIDWISYRAAGGLGLEPARWPGKKLVVFDSYNSVLFEARLKECAEAGSVSVRIHELHEGTIVAVASSDAEPTVYYCIAVPVPLVQAWGTAISKISGVDLVGTGKSQEVFSEADIYMGLFFHYVITKDSYVLEPEPSADMT